MSAKIAVRKQHKGFEIVVERDLIGTRLPGWLPGEIEDLLNSIDDAIKQYDESDADDAEGEKASSLDALFRKRHEIDPTLPDFGYYRFTGYAKGPRATKVRCAICGRLFGNGAVATKDDDGCWVHLACDVHKELMSGLATRGVEDA